MRSLPTVTNEALRVDWPGSGNIAIRVNLVGIVEEAVSILVVLTHKGMLVHATQVIAIYVVHRILYALVTGLDQG